MITPPPPDWWTDPAVIEALAAVEHERWSHWQKYLHSQCAPGADGSLVIPPELVHRWQTQAHTSYADMSEQEKDSDREQVRYYLATLRDLAQREGSSSAHAPE